MTRIAYLPGDGIGPEVSAVARRIATAAGLDAEWIEGRVGWSEWCTHGDPLPQETRRLLDDTDACLFGAITSHPQEVAQAALPSHLAAQGRRYESPILRIRREKGLHLNVRPNRFWTQVPGPLRDAPTGQTITIFRENSEDLYVGVEAYPVPAGLGAALGDHLPNYRRFQDHPAKDIAISTRVITRQATHRLLDAAFRHAAHHGIDQVTLAEKANVLRATGALVLETAQEVAREHPHIRLAALNVDALAAELVTRPHAHPIIAATNLFGDLLSDVAAAVTGGLGLAASANLGDDYALFEPVHGSAPDIAGTGRANPLAAVRSAAMLAAHLGQDAVANRIEAAVAALIADGAVRTPDLGGSATTDDVAAALLDHIGADIADRGTPTATAGTQ